MKEGVAVCIAGPEAENNCLTERVKAQDELIVLSTDEAQLVLSVLRNHQEIHSSYFYLPVSNLIEKLKGKMPSVASHN